ncbi:MAG: fibronectin type III domain-containing protein [Clostridiales bacterium]|nr:fibronectin type III domain-containing protein [Clostridiales bacterium]
MENKTVYFLTQDTIIILPDTNWYWEYGYPGRDVGGSVNNAYYAFEGGLGDGNSYCSLDFVSEQTADSDGIFDYVYRIRLYGYDSDTETFGDSYSFYFVVVAEDYLTSPVKSVNLTPTLTNASSGIKVSWSKSSAAAGYYVYRKTSSASSYSLIKTITSNTTLSYVDTAVKKKNGTTYYYKVVPYSGSDTGTSDAVNIVRLTAPTLSSVKNTASKKITVKWKKNAKATGYQIQYSTSKTFASGNKTVKVSGAKKVSKVISKLTKKKTYYVRIRTYKTVNGKTYYSAWSSKKSVKIKK